MANHRIIITISTTPGVVLDYEQFTNGQSTGPRNGRHARGIAHSDTIRWRCDAGDFAVLFKRNPLDIGVLSASSGNDTQMAHVTAAHTGNTTNDTYQYFAVVMANGVAKFEDPDIIIDT